MAGKINYFEILKRGFRINRLVITTYLYDLAFYAALILIFLIFTFLFKDTILGIKTINLSAFTSSDVTAIYSNAKLLEILFVKMIGIIILFLVSAVMLFSLFKGLIWTELLGKKLNLKYYLKSLVMNILLGIIFSALFVYFALTKHPIIAMLAVPIFMHFNAVSYYFFTKENKIFSSIWKSLKFTFTKILKYIFPYITIIIILVIIILISRTLTNLLPSSISSFILVLIIVFAFSIFRYYFTKFMENIENVN